ncbi:MAG: phospholipase D-like domain-containing protein [bacterium]
MFWFFPLFLLLLQPSSDTIKVWFAQDSLGLRLVDFFNQATVSIDYCCYNSSRVDVTLALINAHNRGVRVRVITDDVRLTNDWVTYLRAAGIPVWSDSVSTSRSAYMHNKFAIRDCADEDPTNDLLWVASYNPNRNEFYADCALEIPHANLCSAYLSEFNQMWGSAGFQPVAESAKFHSAKQDRLHNHYFDINGHPAYVYFSPQNRIVDTIAAFTGRAQSEIFFAINFFTYDPLADTMIAHKNRGITVAGTIDKAGANDPASEYPRLRSWHIPILIDSVPFGNGVLHEKIMVIDSTWSVTGSANWSSNANSQNDENTLILSAPEVARRFHEEILTRYLEANGTYPPGIFERPPFINVLKTSPNPVRVNLLIQDEIYDALGRRVPKGNPPPTGVFFKVIDGRYLYLLIK